MNDNDLDVSDGLGFGFLEKVKYVLGVADLGLNLSFYSSMIV